MTPQTQFTPGPWTLTKNTARIEVHTSPREAYAFSLKDEANARLIASAPSLYAALQAILDSRPEIAGFGQDEFRDAINNAEILIRSLDLGSSTPH